MVHFYDVNENNCFMFHHSNTCQNRCVFGVGYISVIINNNTKVAELLFVSLRIVKFITPIEQSDDGKRF